VAKKDCRNGSESLKKCHTAPTYHEGRILGTSTAFTQHIQLPDTTGTSNGTEFCRQMNLKKKKLQAQKLLLFFAHRDKKKVPHG